MADPTTSNELVITRIFDAPRELVYRAFIDPDQLAQWFGPVGWSVPRDTVDIDARVGGQLQPRNSDWRQRFDDHIEQSCHLPNGHDQAGDAEHWDGLLHEVP